MRTAKPNSTQVRVNGDRRKIRIWAQECYFGAFAPLLKTLNLILVGAKHRFGMLTVFTLTHSRGDLENYIAIPVGIRTIRIGFKQTTNTLDSQQTQS